MLRTGTYWYHQRYVKQHGDYAEPGLPMEKVNKRKRKEGDRYGKRRQGEDGQPVSTPDKFALYAQIAQSNDRCRRVP
jgi:hypothetical protein